MYMLSYSIYLEMGKKIVRITHLLIIWVKNSKNYLYMENIGKK